MPAVLCSSDPDSTPVNWTSSRRPVVDTTTPHWILAVATGARPAPMGSTASLGVRRSLCRCSTPPSPRPIGPPRASPSDLGGRARPRPWGSSSVRGQTSLPGHRGELPRPSPSSDKELRRGRGVPLQEQRDGPPPQEDGPPECEGRKGGEGGATKAGRACPVASVPWGPIRRTEREE
jgi:hypothetical protein